MKSKLFWFGAVASATYIGIMFWFFGWRFHRLLGQDLNEVGDFLAGAFSPLAFLWLVLGFMQQGQELRISSEALVKQVDEMKNSVAQSTALVEIAGRQLAAEMESVTFERERLAQARKPKFKLSGRVPSSDGVTINAFISVENYGGLSQDLVVKVGQTQFLARPLMNTGASAEFPINFEKREVEYPLQIRCVGEDGVVEEEFGLTVSLSDIGSSIAKLIFSPKPKAKNAV